jgi:hypothetical protein
MLTANVLALSGCQQPTASSETTNVDDFVDASAPDTIDAETPADGRSYRVARSNESDLIVAYQYKVSFTATVTMNSNSSQSKYDIEFPVTMSQASIKVNQASGGIIVPPSGSDTEHSEYVISQATGNKFGAPSTSVSMRFDVWYSLPSQLKEAVITASFNIYDNNGKSFTKTATIKVAP